jgi:hypothetical protein
VTSNPVHAAPTAAMVASAIATGSGRPDGSCAAPVAGAAGGNGALAVPTSMSIDRAAAAVNGVR